ncbi:MAG: 30S ribosomal protein S12 methylthiotransferase RimO [Clostridia bacterium]|nr:30S ribosomal protein S12 methylthiotransferase RimO [Clostridia bacterium]
MQAKVGFVSLGCPKNEVDCEMMLARVAQAGYEIVPEDTQADVVIVNTCAFIESAKEEGIENILDLAWLKENRSLRGIIVTGCMAQRYFTELEESLPEVDAALSLGEEVHICEAIEAVMKGEKYFRHSEPETLALEGDRVFTHESFAYLRIAEGCNNRCSYCAIPGIRGNLRSRPMESILEEAKSISQMGIREICVVAQDTTVYGLDLYGRLALPELLEKLASKELGFRWIRLMYCYPDKVTEELCRTMASHENICHYIDLPIQHISDEVLKNMNRHGGREAIENAISLLRGAMPDIAIRTTVMLGFPGEKDRDFSQLSHFVKDTRFARLGAFIYSREEGTPAYSMENRTTQKTKDGRLTSIMQTQLAITEEYNASFVGKTWDVVVEGYDPGVKMYFGRTAFHAPEIDGVVYFTSGKKELPVGEYVSVLVEEVMEYDLIGKEVRK